MSITMPKRTRGASRGRQNLVLIVPLLALLLARVLAAPPHRGSYLLAAAGTVAILAGLVVRVLSRQWKAERSAGGLVTDGPYACVRNPLYLGSFLLGTGLCLLVGDLLFFVAFQLFFWISHLLVIRREEAALTEAFGDEYRDYRRAAPALFPQRWPRATLLPRDLGQAIIRECDSICAWLALPLVIHLTRWLVSHPPHARPTEAEALLLAATLLPLLGLTAAWLRMKASYRQLIRAERAAGAERATE